jgi:Zn finger protein HypA/HybF involved in hydrogenase expression
MDMSACRHLQLVLLPEQKNRLRCRHCHLTINADELTSRYCPECFESSGRKRYDFDEVAEVKDDVARYRCEDCGVMIEAK